MGLDWGLKDSWASVRQGYRGRGFWADGIPLQRHKGVKKSDQGKRGHSGRTGRGRSWKVTPSKVRTEGTCHYGMQKPWGLSCIEKRRVLGKKGLWASMQGAGRRRKDRGDSGTPEKGVLRARGERMKWAK